MILVTGGAYQGKHTFAAEKLGIPEEKILDGSVMALDFTVKGIVCIDNFHLLIKRVLESGNDPIPASEMLIKNNPDIVVITDEIGSGIIPAEKNERVYREKTGQICCYLAHSAVKVIRITCGISSVIKE